MKVVLCSNVEHYRYSAIAIQNAHMLERYVTGAFYKKKPWYYSISAGNKVWIDNRIESKFDYDKVRSLKIHDILFRMIRNNKFITSFIKRDSVDAFFYNLFDLYCCYNLKFLKDVTCFHYEESIGSKSAIKAKKKFNCKVIIDDRAEHRGFLYNVLKEEYKRLNMYFDEKQFWKLSRNYDIVDYIIVPSTYCKYTFETQGIPKEKLVVIPYGCDLNRFYPIKNENDRGNRKFRVISVGRICVRKGIRYLIDALKKIENRDIELLLIGQVERGLEKLVEDLPENIKYIPYIPNSELNKLYSSSDVFVLPSLSDSFSLATIEAMASGTPVIVSENVGAKEYVVEGENGYVVPIMDSDSIKEKLLLLYKNRDKISAMGKAARESVINLSWDEYGKKLINFYKSIDG